MPVLPGIGAVPVTETDAQAAARQLYMGLSVMEGWISTFEEDPGKALAHLTMLGLLMAQKCQQLTEGVIDERDPNGERRFFSLDGGLFRSTGAVVQFDRDFLTILDTAREEADR